MYTNNHYVHLKDYIIDIYQSKTPKEFDKAYEYWEKASQLVWEKNGEEYPKIKEFMEKFVKDKKMNREHLSDPFSPITTNNDK